MSWNFNNAGGFELTGLSLSLTDISIACWYKNVNGGGDEELVLIDDASDNVPRALLEVRNDVYACRAEAQNASNQPALNVVSNSAGGYTWHLAIMTIDADGNGQAFTDNGAGSATALSYSWPGATMNRIRFGCGWAQYASGKARHLAIWNKVIDSTARAALWAGDNPASIETGNLLYYWNDSKTATVGTGTFSAVGTEPTWDSGDNPTVDDPPAGGSVVPILMSHYHQMMGA